MALFNLTDIAYKKEEGRYFFSFSGFSGGRNNYNPNLLRYPSDLGNTDKGHYMVFNIHVQKKTSYVANEDKGDPKSQIQKNREALRAEVGATNIGGAANMILDKMRSLAGVINSSIPDIPIPENVKKAAETFGGNIADKISPGTKEEAQKFGKGVKQAVLPLDEATFLRTTKRTTDSIALYMPNTLVFEDRQIFTDISLGGELATLGAAGATVLNDAGVGTKSFDAQALGKNATPFIADFIADKVGKLAGINTTNAIFASLVGAVKNPQLEMIYTSPAFRSFSFEFMFYPRSEKEAKEVQDIIQRLRFHQAPEILSGSAGYFMVPPSEFDIEFRYNGEVNPNIPKISTCVLTSVNVDYAPNGFRAYEVPGENKPEMGSTGMPVGIRLNLSFLELEIMTKFNYRDKTNRREV
jgi:hypothetical protein